MDNRLRHRDGRFKARPATEVVPLLLSASEISRAARIMARHRAAKTRAQRAAYVARHCAALIGSMNAEQELF